LIQLKFDSIAKNYQFGIDRLHFVVVVSGLHFFVGHELNCAVRYAPDARDKTLKIENNFVVKETPRLLSIIAR